MIQYQEALKFLIENGIEKTDRTGIGTKSIFGYQMRFNLSDGFPAITTKKLAFKGVVSELLWFLEGSTDERRLAEIQYGKPRQELIGKQTIWTANADAQGKALGYANDDKQKLLGPVYGYGWRRTTSLNSDVIIEVKNQNFNDAPPVVIIEDAIVCQNDEFINKIIINKYNTEYKVLEKIKTPRNSSYIIQCLLTGHKETVTRPNIKNKSFGQKILFGRFFSTARKNKNIHHYNKAYMMWYNMINRCYNINHPNYKEYGGSGIIVDKRWNNFETFLHDIESLPFFYEWVKGVNNKINNWCIDKDYYNTNIYSKDTCIFLPSKINKSYSNHEIDFTKKIVVEFPDTTTHEFIFIDDIIARFPDKRFNKESIRQCLNGDQITHKSCKFYRKNAKENHVFRKKIVFDQINELVSEIKNNPDSRRLILTAWNPNQIREMALPPCHTLAQFYVINNKLSCQLYQRSADFVLGSPFNIASYSLLTHMIAQVCGLDVGDFVYTIGDMHIYNNHIEGAKIQLEREPLALPKLWLNPDIKNILDFKMEDIKLIDYNSHDKIYFPMAV